MNVAITVRRAACIAALTSVAVAWGSGQTVPRDPQAITTVPSPARDRPLTPRVGTGVIRGRIVDGVTGRPVVRARVRLMGTGGTRGPILTDATGAFAFEQLAPGGYRIMSEKSTYITSSHPDPQRSIRNRAQQLTIADKQVLDDITIPIFHSAAIAGRIVDAHGDPIEGAMVNVMTPPRGGRPQMRSGAQTNDLGEFRISRLSAGRYILMVRAQPGSFGGDASTLDPPIPQPIPTYYPGTPSLEEARPIILNRGETLTGIDMSLGEGIPTVVTGMVISSDGQPIANVNVSARSGGVDGFGGFESGTGVRPDGTFRLLLTPGEYMLEARSFARVGPGEPQRPENEQYGVSRITVMGAAADSIVILLGRGATASGRIIFEGNTPPPPPLQGQVPVPLYSPSGMCRPGRATVAADWTFKIEGLAGTCSAQPSGMFGRWTLKAVTIRGQNVMDQSMTFEAGQSYSNVTIVVTDKRTQVAIEATDESGQVTREYAALLFPADKDRWGQLTRYVRAQAPGAMPLAAVRGAPPPGRVSATGMDARPGIVRMPGLPAGDYYAIALDDIDPEDMMEPTVLEKLIPSATRVSVSEDAPVEIVLRRFSFHDVIR